MLSEIEEFLVFLGNVLIKNCEASHTNVIVHAATRDTLQRLSDNLPQVFEDFKNQKNTPVLDSTVAAPEGLPASPDSEPTDQ